MLLTPLDLRRGDNHIGSVANSMASKDHAQIMTFTKETAILTIPPAFRAIWPQASLFSPAHRALWPQATQIQLSWLCFWQPKPSKRSPIGPSTLDSRTKGKKRP